MEDNQTRLPDNQADGTQTPAADAGGSEAVELIRDKVARLYQTEPDASQEISEAKGAVHRSKHQQFMYSLSTSGRDLATVQTEWHNYYQNLSDDEKRQVWQEFYASQPTPTPIPAAPSPAHALSEHKQQAANVGQAKAKLNRQNKLSDGRSSADIKAAIRDKVSAGGKLQPKHHIQSLLFGLGTGAVVIIIFLFGFFNQLVIAPLIQPGRANADTPLILSSNDVAPTTTPEVIIPKINVEIPVNYSETSTDEAAIENDLLDGVVHYPTTAVPGQDGNAAFFGHSSNNIFNPGKYKFAFVLLHTLVNGDTFYLTYNDKVYVYKVISHTIVDPNDVGVLNPVSGQTATATLITCDPPGTSLHRLVVVGQQISPSPAGNAAASSSGGASTTAGASPTLPGNGPSLWSRVAATIVGKIVIVAVALGVVFVVTRGFVKAFRPRLA